MLNKLDLPNSLLIWLAGLLFL